MNETVFCRCSTCGYEWKRGQHGGHDCAQILDAHYEAVSAQSAARIAELEKRVKDLQHIIDEENKDHIEQQAIAQADNVRLREALDAIAHPEKHLALWATYQPRMPDYVVHRGIADKALAQPLDTSALDAYVANFAVRTAQLEGQVAMLRAKLDEWKRAAIEREELLKKVEHELPKLYTVVEQENKAPLPPAPGKQGEE